MGVYPSRLQGSWEGHITIILRANTHHLAVPGQLFLCLTVMPCAQGRRGPGIPLTGTRPDDFLKGPHRIHLSNVSSYYACELVHSSAGHRV